MNLVDSMDDVTPTIPSFWVCEDLGHLNCSELFL